MRRKSNTQTRRVLPSLKKYLQDFFYTESIAVLSEKVNDITCHLPIQNITLPNITCPRLSLLNISVQLK